MKERPILFSGSMVRAILEGRKTQTRRVCRNQPPMGRDVSPYGEAGDRLWVRETVAFRIDCEPGTPKAVHYLCFKADGGDLGMSWHSMSGWKPSIHMPRWASRITLEVVSVRAEQLHDISHKDALAEGVSYDVSKPDGAPLPRFRELWDSINAKRGYGWDVNPWVWVIEFKPVQP